mmetsp:Transcript_82678/g.252677  ORF Transcript_82678/g.252677 Transcript_82678/m.252677 type:complete len:462 (-) Transcript_82678:1687-3072(-)
MVSHFPQDDHGGERSRRRQEPTDGDPGAEAAGPQFDAPLVAGRARRGSSRPLGGQLQLHGAAQESGAFAVARRAGRGAHLLHRFPGGSHRHRLWPHGPALDEPAFRRLDLSANVRDAVALANERCCGAHATGADLRVHPLAVENHLDEAGTPVDVRCRQELARQGPPRQPLARRVLRRDPELVVQGTALRQDDWQVQKRRNQHRRLAPAKRGRRGTRQDDAAVRGRLLQKLLRVPQNVRYLWSVGGRGAAVRRGLRRCVQRNRRRYRPGLRPPGRRAPPRHRAPRGRHREPQAARRAQSEPGPRDEPAEAVEAGPRRIVGRRGPVAGDVGGARQRRPRQAAADRGRGFDRKDYDKDRGRDGPRACQLQEVLPGRRAGQPSRRHGFPPKHHHHRSLAAALCEARAGPPPRRPEDDAPHPARAAFDVARHARDRRRPDAAEAARSLRGSRCRWASCSDTSRPH